MPVKKQIVDSIRIKILSAMTEKKAVTPNIRQIQKITGFHRATIKSSINFLEENEFITGYRPLLNPVKAGYTLKSHTYLQMDLNEKEKLKSFIATIKADPNVVSCSQVITDRYTNVCMTYLSKGVEDYYNNVQKKYYLSVPKIYDFVDKRIIYYLSKPYYKYKNEIDATIDILKSEVGID